MTTTQLTTTAIPRIGQPWPEQGGIYIGVCPGQHGQPDYHLIAATDPRALFKDVQWHARSAKVALANSDWDGKANTIAMAEAASELAGALLDLQIGGHHDFYLPARHELRLVKLVAPDLIVDNWHWSSTQYSADYAWCQTFGGGGQYGYDKDDELRARAVRRLLIIQ
jgi:hypothetical protein